MMYKLRSMSSSLRAQQCSNFIFQAHLRALRSPDKVTRAALARRYLHNEVSPVLAVNGDPLAISATNNEGAEKPTEDNGIADLRLKSYEERPLNRKQQSSFRTQCRSADAHIKTAQSEEKKTSMLDLLSKPSWSIRSLLPPATGEVQDEITPQHLHHLLRISALPMPKSEQEERKMLDTLHQQLHFVREIQGVDTEGVEPLCSLRDESSQGEREATIGLETKEIREALANEEVVGRMRRPRRRSGRMERVERRDDEEEDWDVFATAGETVEHAGSRYFVVRSGKGE